MSQGVRIPEVFERKTVVWHGAFGFIAETEIVRHFYAGVDDGPTGFREILEFSNPPQGRMPYALHEYLASRGRLIVSFISLDDALAASKSNWLTPEKAERLIGMVFVEHLGYELPWFYSASPRDPTMTIH